MPKTGIYNFERYVSDRSKYHKKEPAVSINASGAIYLNVHLVEAMKLKVSNGYVEMYYDKIHQMAGIVPLNERTEDSLKFSKLGSADSGTVGTGTFSAHFKLSRRPVKGIPVEKHNEYYIFKWPLAEQEKQ